MLAFEKHNPAADVVRCPRGRSDIRRRLDAYARAAVYLPFRDTIIYDSLFGIMPISFGPGMQENIRQWKKEAEQFPLITSL
ncbi:MAG: hypothetical protein LBR77_07480 [Lachnospiraceae bacterium]|nr:hypothetical protein [Lachnospiraceae bacterium]